MRWPSGFTSCSTSRKLPHGILPEVRGDEDRKFDSFNLTSALYHVSGATAFTFECPHGVDEPKACRVSLEDTLDIELTLYEAMLRFALAAKKCEAAGVPKTKPEGCCRTGFVCHA